MQLKWLNYIPIAASFHFQSSATGGTGDLETAKIHFGISIACNVTGILFAIAGVIAIVVSIIAVIANANEQARNF